MTNPLDSNKHKLILIGHAELNDLDWADDREVDDGPGVCVGISQGPGICVGLGGRSANWQAPQTPSNLDSRLQAAKDYADDEGLPYHFTTTCC